MGLLRPASCLVSRAVYLFAALEPTVRCAEMPKAPDKINHIQYEADHLSPSDSVPRIGSADQSLGNSHYSSHCYSYSYSPLFLVGILGPERLS